MSETDMTDQYAELRLALAAGPTPGPWAWGADSRIATVARVSDYRIGPDHGTSYEAHYEFHAPDHVDAAYAAAANPKTITALLAERDAAIEERDAALQACSDLANEMVYRGNSVAWWHSKATAYRDAIDRCWDALREAGIHPDGKTDVATAIRQLAERSNA